MNTPSILKLIIALLMIVPSSHAHNAPMAKIKGGTYRPLYLKKDTPLIKVHAFQIDKYPVSNADFWAFVQQYPQWQRGQLTTKQAENSYLRQWIKTLQGFAPKSNELQYPVTNVSWFAAHAYCKAQGKRLPTIDEWEFTAQASETKINGSQEKGYNRKILDWYADGGKRGLINIGQSRPNYWGVHDLHGLIWEWTEDFNSSLLTASTADNGLFCSGASVGSSDPSNYAAFMRYGIRTALQSRYVLNNLGFRCAK